MKKVKFTLSSVILIFSLSYAAPASSDASATLDSLVAGATFSYTGGDHRKLDQIGRHAVSFGRLRYYNPTNPVNLINLTPPSIGTPNCSSININLGSFDIISLDEAVNILRRVANEALTYGFGLALQSMCSPCWSGMQTLRDQLNRFNQANRNTCEFSKRMVNNLTDNGESFKIFDDMCDTSAQASGDDNYLCKLGDALSIDDVKGGIDTMESWLTSLGEDTTGVFTLGNVIYWGFDTIAQGGAMPQNVFSQDLSRLILGVPHTDQSKQYSMAEAAMNLFGYYRVGADQDTDGNPGEAKHTSGPVGPAITDITSLYKDPIDCSAAENCAKVYVCYDVVLDSETFSCMSHEEHNKNYEQVLIDYRDNFPDYCTDELTNPTIEDVLHCEVQAAFTKLIDEGETTLSALQRNIIKASNPAVVRAFAVGTNSDKDTLAKILSESLGKFLTYDLIATYITQMATFTYQTLSIVEKETTVTPVKFLYVREAIKDKINQASELRKLANLELKELNKTTAYTDILKEYEKSLATEVTTIINN